MDDFKPSVLEYLGKVENGILVLLAITYSGNYYESTFFYNEKDLILTISTDLEEIIGDITKHPQYPKLIQDILKLVVPYSEMIDKIDPVDFSRWVKGVVEFLSEVDAQKVNPEEIKNKE